MSTFEKVAHLLIAVLLLAPLISVRNTQELFEFPKTFFVYITGILLIVLFILKLINVKRFYIKPPAVTLGFVGAMIIATLTSSHVYTSVWGYYSRFNGGLVSVLIFFGIYLALLNSRIEGVVNKLLPAILGSVAAVAIYQHCTGVTRAYSTLGQPNWAAAFLVMGIAFVLPKLQNHKIYWMLYIVSTMGLWFTYSLSGILGFALMLITSIVLNKFTKKQLMFMLGVPLVIALFWPGIFGSRVKDTLVDTPIAQTTYNHNNYTISDPGYIRKGMWQGTLKLIISSPKILLIGSGLQTFPYEFQQFRPKSMNMASEWNFILNKPHNYYLELASEVGLLGLSSYLLILGYGLKTRHPTATPALIGLAITNMFGWPTVSTTLLFWVALALIERYKVCAAN